MNNDQRGPTHFSHSKDVNDFMIIEINADINWCARLVERGSSHTQEWRRESER